MHELLVRHDKNLRVCYTCDGAPVFLSNVQGSPQGNSSLDAGEEEGRKEKKVRRQGRLHLVVQLACMRVCVSWSGKRRRWQTWESPSWCSSERADDVADQVRGGGNDPFRLVFPGGRRAAEVWGSKSIVGPELGVPEMRELGCYKLCVWHLSGRRTGEWVWEEAKLR